MKRTIWSLIFVTILISVPRLSAADPETFSFANPTVRIPVAARDGSDEIVLRTSVPQKSVPEIKDDQLTTPAGASVIFERINDGSDSANSWRYKVTVRGLSPGNIVQQHYAVIGTQLLPYVVTNQPVGSFAWSIQKPPDPWVGTSWFPFSSAGPCIGFTVTPKDSPATGVSIAGSTLVEQTTKVAIPVTVLRLCRGEDNDCAQQESTRRPIDLPANTPSALKICSAEPHHGNFHGTVVLASLQKPDGDTILQSASFSTTFTKWVGFVLIALGVVLAWFVKVYLRGRLDRDQALRPVTYMRSQVLRMQQTLAGLRAPYKPTPTNLNAALTALLNELSTPVLDLANLLPPRIPNPMGAVFDPAALKSYLEVRNPRVQLLSILIDEGVVRAEAEDNGGAHAPVAAINAAITQIDNMWLAVPQPALDAALQQVRHIVATLHAGILGLAAVPPPIGPIPPLHGEFDVLQLEIGNISIIIWAVYALLTALSGVAVLVLNNPGFGIPLDLIFAFFWGFGVPTAIQSLTPTSAATALNISIAKT